MKAAQISDYGDASVIQVNEIAKPIIEAGKVLVEVHAASLNPFDSKLRDGAMKDSIKLNFPVTLGGDFAGVVTEVGDGVTDFVPGDEVFGQAIVVAGNSGAFADFASAKATSVARKPVNLSFAEAASLPLVGSSAVQALIQHINLQSEQKIFIHGGAGGIGSLAIQIAKYLGAYVATTATGDNIDFVKQLGADEVIDYKVEDFSEKLHDFDAVYDTVGHDDFVKAFSILKRGGVAVSMTAEPDEAKAQEQGITALTQFTKVTTETLNELRKLVEAEAVKPQVDQSFTLDDIQTAFVARENGSGRGKVVLQIKG